MKHISICLFIVLCGIVQTACVYTPVKGYSENTGIHSRYLEFWYKEQLLPAYWNYLEQAVRLDEIAGRLKRHPEALGEMKEQFETALLALQDIIIFDQPCFAGRLYGLYAVSARFPVNKTQLENAVRQHYDIKDLSERLEKGVLSPAALGYAALDYLLFSGEVDLLNESGQAYLDFLPSLTGLLAQEAKAADAYYKNSEEGFTGNNDFSVSGSLNTILNTLMSNFESNIRTAKVGIPIGIYGISSHQPAPVTVEAYYHAQGLSTRMLERAILRFRDFYHGRPYKDSSAENEEAAFSAMLEEYLPPEKWQDIHGKMEHVFMALQAELKGEKKDVAQLAVDKDGAVKLRKVYDELQKVVGMLKTDVVSALGLTVTYSDGEEGD